MKILKADTAVTVHVGPFVDKDDGVSIETGLTTGTVDEIVIYKHEGTTAVDISGTTTFTHRAGGMYTATLSATDTNTEGHLRLFVREVATALTVWEDFQVVAANVYDSLFAVTGTDRLQVDVQEYIGAAAPALVGGRYDASVGAMAANVLTSSALASSAVDEIVDQVWDEDIVAAHGTADTAGRCIRTLDAISDRTNNSNLNALLGVADSAGRDLPEQAWLEGTRTLTAATNITSSGGVINVTAGVVDTVGALGATAKADVNAEVDTALADANLNDLIQITGSVSDVTPAAGNFDGNAGLSATNDFYNGMVLVFTSGTLAGIARRISDYDGTSKLITLENAFPVAPADSDTFSIIGLEVMRDAIDEIATVQSDTDNIQTRLPATLDTGRMRCVVESMNANVVTLSAMAAGAIDSTVFAAGALDANALATDAVDEIVDQVWDEAKAGHVGAGSFGEEVQSHATSTEVSNVETDTQDIQGRLPTVLIGGRMDSTMTAIAGDTTSASRLKDSAGTMVTATVQTGSDLDTITTDLTETTDEHYKGRVVIFLTGNLANQAVEITAYTGASKDLTVTSMTEAPANGDTFVIV